MPKVLIVSPTETAIARALIAQTLRNLGIDYAFATNSSINASVNTPAGAFAPDSPDLRNYFRQYDAVIVTEQPRYATNLSTGASARWLGWNAPEDPPIAYCGWNFATTVSQYDGQLPSDFPLIRIDASNLSETAALADEGASINWSTFAHRHGTPVYLHREAATVYVPTACGFPEGSSRPIAYWRYNPTLHSTLANQPYTHPVALNGKAGEILATPANLPPDADSYPPNTVIAYRYYNRFLLPTIARTGAAPSLFPALFRANPYPDLFWLLYALKLCRVPPAWSVPLQLETDHPLELRPQSANLTDLMKAQIKRDNFDWLRSFCRTTGLVLCNGVQVGGRDRSPTETNRHWVVINHSDPDIRAMFQQAHKILVTGHREGTLMCGVHDHSINDTRGYGARNEMTNFVRHSDAGSRYGAPNNVPIQHGRYCVAKHVAPNGVPPDAIETTIGDTTILEWDFTGRMSGTSTTITTMPMQNVHAARVVLESELMEMQAMGFPDGHCGEHRYTNTAANNAGGIAWWQAAKELGFRALRSSYCCNEHSNPATPGANNQTVPPHRIWHGVHLLHPTALDIASSSEPSTWGLYDPNAGATNRHAVGLFGLDSTSGDITAQWSTNRHAAAWRAHRRALCHLTANYLSASIMQLSACYFHPAWHWYGTSPTQSVARFDGENILNANGQPHWNPTVELLENLRVIVSVLSDYLKFGSISDLIMVRERVLT